MKFRTFTNRRYINSMVNKLNHLHNNGSMSYWYNIPDYIEIISYAKLKDKYVGCCIITKGRDLYNIGVCILPELRLQGIGKELVIRAIKKTDKEIFFFDRGFREKFFKDCIQKARKLSTTKP